MYILRKKLTFDAAHQLIDSPSLTTKKCTNMHGHRWVIDVKIETNTLKDGFVIDFGRLKEIIGKYDHRCINEVIELNPTAENLAFLIHREIKLELQNPLLLSVTVEEGPGAKITYYENYRTL